MASICLCRLEFQKNNAVNCLQNRLFPLAQFVVAIALATVKSPAFAMTFHDAIDLAVRNDPTFLAAQANLHVSQERANQAVAGLFPQVTFTGSTNVNAREYTPKPRTPSLFVRNTTVKEHYNSSTARVQLTQPLWRPNLVNAMAQADLNVNQADFELMAASQDLLVRLTQAWFEAMQARDTLDAAKVHVDVTHLQLELSRDGYDKGVLSMVQLEDARAKYMQANAESAQAESSLEMALAGLEQIVGASSFAPPLLAEEAAQPSVDESVDAWLQRAEEGNPSFLAAQQALAAANQEIRKQSSGHEPSLDLVASYGRSTQEAGLTGGQAGFESYEGSFGLQLNIPLYSGGGQSAKVREAEAGREKAAQQLELTRRKMRTSVKQAWFGWQASHARETASQIAVEAATLALDGARAAREHGTKGEIDVLQLQHQYAAAVRDWRKARYESIVNRLKLKAAGGELVRDDLAALDKALAPAANLP